MKNFTLYSIFFFLNILPNLWAQSDTPSETKIITITGHPDYNPVTYQDKNRNSIEGIAVERLRKAVEKMGYKLKSVYTGTWARAQEEVKIGRIDILLPPYKTDERMSWLEFQEKPFMMDETAIFVRKNRSIKFNELSDLLKYRGVAIINDSFGDEFDKFDREKLKLKRLASTEQCFRFLLKERADFLVAGLYAGNRVLESMREKENFIVLPKRVIITGMYAGISKKSETFKKNPKLREKLEEYLLEKN